MRRIIKLAAAASIAFTSTALAGPPAPPVGMTWAPVPSLSDEFDGERLDISKWRPEHPYWSGSNSRFVPENVYVRGGYLHLRSSVLPKPETDDGRTVWISAADVTSKTELSGPGYYFEARFKASRTPMAATFWAQGKDDEIDVDEAIGGSISDPGQDRIAASSTHYFPQGWASETFTTTRTKMWGRATQFHTFGAWWVDAHTARFYQDGKMFSGQRTRGELSAPMLLFFSTVLFDEEAPPSRDMLLDPRRNEMLVDWVRVWKLVPAAG